MATLPILQEPFVINLLVSALLYGMYISSLGLCLRWLVFADEGWKLRKSIDIRMIIAAILIFASSTLHLGAVTQLAVDDALGKLGATLDTVTELYNMGAMTQAALFVVILVTDAVMIYRCWVVYNKSWLAVILPVLFWLGCLTSFILIFYYNHLAIQMVLNAPEANRATMQSINAKIALYPCNAATSIYTTAAITYRVSTTASASSDRLRKLCRILTETGIIYTLSTIFTLIVFVRSTLDSSLRTLTFVAQALNFFLAGIAFNLILVSVGQGRVSATSSHSRKPSDQQNLLSSGYSAQRRPPLSPTSPTSGTMNTLTSTEKHVRTKSDAGELV